jgi:two-component system response regulator PilR (NtrC family)
MRNYLSAILGREGYRVETAADGVSALEVLGKQRFEVVVADIKMPKLDGIELLRAIKSEYPDTEVMVITAYSTWASAVEAMRLGAYNYIRKPFDNEEIRQTVRRALELVRLRRQQKPGTEIVHLDSLIGNSPQMREVRDLILRVGPTDGTVLIQGESGTGKELVARTLHFTSTRSQANFIAVSVAAFPETLLESELFGHLRGAFTNAYADKKGLLELADKGTFFLDEVAEMSPSTQVKLLRVLEQRDVKPLGATRSVKVDLRFIAATNRDLEEEVRRRHFREDLFYRLNVIPMKLAPLRAKRGDIPLLAGHFLARVARTMSKEVSEISPETLEALVSYDWPGNVRELINVVERAVALSRTNRIELSDLDEKLRAAEPRTATNDYQIPPTGIDLGACLQDVERGYILRALAMTGGSITRAAKLLHTSFRSLRYRIKKLGIKVSAGSD